MSGMFFGTQGLLLVGSEALQKVSASSRGYYDGETAFHRSVHCQYQSRS